MIEILKLPDPLHQRVVDWQNRHFNGYRFLLDRWSDFYRQEPFQLVAKYGPLKSESIEVGKFAGRPKFRKAAELDEEMIQQTAKIVKAQCSTELGSIQQHRESLSKAQDPKMQFDILRVMAEELRHAYQMLHILAADDWGPVGKNLADETMDQLLGMQTGGHVLDAFNLFFDSFVDNVTFCAIIDRVGKYQLAMQQVFSYAPMARSMAPMLSEEAFHLASGVNPMKSWARDAAAGTGNVSSENLQKHINKWSPRGLEMFGDERGGKTVVEFGFKDMSNGDAMDRYFDELKKDVVDPVNYETVKVRIPGMSRPDAVALADRIVAAGAPEQGIRPEELYYRPAKNFFRRRGLHAFQMNDVRGNPVAGGIDAYLSSLRAVLPDSYVTGPDFRTYAEHLRQKIAGQEVKEEGLPFYG